MPSYTQTTLGQLLTQLGTILDDSGSIYWTPAERTFAVQEALLTWGALTGYWRTRGAFATNSSTTWYDLSQLLPTLRSRAWTLNQLTQEIQFACFEPANGISGAGMSQQVSIGNILAAIARARNRWVIDSHQPYSILSSRTIAPPPGGLVSFDQSVVYVHRAGWLDVGPGGPGRWTNLWREDSWSVDHGNPLWTIEPSAPTQYSEAELAPLEVQLSPGPTNEGQLEILAVESLALDLTNPAQTFAVPDEWVHALKYAALSDLWSTQSQIYDPLRAQYAESRYTQLVQFAQDARSLLRVLVNGVPLALDSLAALDAGQATWRNQAGVPSVAGSLYDLFALNTIPSQTYGVTCDVAAVAPYPVSPGQFIPVGIEDLDTILNFATHLLTLKCGGKEFTATLVFHDQFLAAASRRMGINRAKVRYLEPLFGIPQREQQIRPDALTRSGTGAAVNA